MAVSAPDGDAGSIPAQPHLLLDLEKGEMRSRMYSTVGPLLYSTVLVASFGVFFKLLLFGWPFMLSRLEMLPGEAETRHPGSTAVSLGSHDYF